MINFWKQLRQKSTHNFSLQKPASSLKFAKTCLFLDSENADIFHLKSNFILFFLIKSSVILECISLSKSNS